MTNIKQDMIGRRLYFTLIVIFNFYFFLSAQVKNNELIGEAQFYADVMMNAEDIAHRQRAALQFYPLLMQLLQQNQSFDDDYAGLRWISRKYSEDKNFRIFSWYVPVNNEENRYYGILQTKEGKLFELKDGFKTTGELDADVEEFDTRNWPGAMYYNIMDVPDANGEKYYLLFGINRWNPMENIKIADVLFFTKSGEPVFGKEVFYKTEPGGKVTKLNRLLVKYSADATVTLNYNPGMEMIVMDHLVPRMSRLKGESTVLVPDGSYSGYILKNGIWEYVDKLYTEILDEAPRPRPVMEGRKNTNIFGKSRKQK